MMVLRAFFDHQRAHRLALPSDLTSFVGAAGGQQLCVETLEIARLRHRHPVVAPEVSGLALDAALFVRLLRRAELTAEALFARARIAGPQLRRLCALAMNTWGFAIALEVGEIRFVEGKDDGGERLSAFDVEVVDRAALLAHARERGSSIEDDRMKIAGLAEAGVVGRDHDVAREPLAGFAQMLTIATGSHLPRRCNKPSNQARTSASISASARPGTSTRWIRIPLTNTIRCLNWAMGMVDDEEAPASAMKRSLQPEPSSGGDFHFGIKPSPTSNLESSIVSSVVQKFRGDALATNRHDDMLARANPIGGRRQVDHAGPPRCIPRHPQV